MPETIAVKPSTRQRSMKALTCTVPEPSALALSALGLLALLGRRRNRGAA